MPTFTIPHICTPPQERGTVNDMRTVHICVINNFAEISSRRNRYHSFSLNDRENRHLCTVFQHSSRSRFICSGKSGSTRSSKIQTQTHTPNFITETELLDITWHFDSIHEKKMMGEFMIFDYSSKLLHFTI